MILIFSPFLTDLNFVILVKYSDYKLRFHEQTNEIEVKKQNLTCAV